MSNQINTNEFFKLNNEIPVVDVRSPLEFEQGHIPGAINIPLFDNEERAKVGTIYKKSGQKDAVLAGLDFAGQKIRKLAESGLKTAKKNKLIIHCWRGGMRSASVAWLLETCGINCYVLKGGYKSYRQYLHEYFSLPFNLIVIGGMTGSGKSDILDELANKSYQVLKLEQLARHKGSVFGNLGEESQNTNEQFENDMFTALYSFDILKPVFVEDESRNIGRNTIPPGFFETMSTSLLLVADMDKELRVQRLVNDYGSFPTPNLIDCITKISKRLGGQNTKDAIASIEECDFEKAAGISLYYYDKTYSFGLSGKKSSEVIMVSMNTTDSRENAERIIDVLLKRGIF